MLKNLLLAKALVYMLVNEWAGLDLFTIDLAHLLIIEIIFLFIHYFQVYANGLRFALTILGGSIAVMGSRIIGYTSAGALGCVMLAFIAGIGWKREELKLTPYQMQATQIVSTQLVSVAFYSIFSV